MGKELRRTPVARYDIILKIQLPFYQIVFRISFTGVYTQVSYFVEWIALAMQ
jgi:hypothetical protein